MGSTAAALLRLLPLLLALLGAGSSQDVRQDALVGNTVKLKITYSGQSTGYIWTKGSHRVAEWDDPGVVTYYGSLKGRCDLDTSTGLLTINNLKEEDSARYKGEALVNNLYVSSNYDLRVFPILKKPMVTCYVLSGNFTLSCDHQPEPPTYTWRNKDVDVTATDLNYWLSNDNKKLTLKNAKVPFQSLECVVQNPVSNSSTLVPLECFEGLIDNEEKTPRRRWVLIFPVIVSLAVCIGFYVCNRTREKQKTAGGGGDKPAEEQSLTQNENACQGPENNGPQSSSGEGGNADDPDQRHLHPDKSADQEPGNGVPQSGRGEGGNADDPEQGSLLQE